MRTIAEIEDELRKAQSDLQLMLIDGEFFTSDKIWAQLSKLKPLREELNNAQRNTESQAY